MRDDNSPHFLIDLAIGIGIVVLPILIYAVFG
jgi:hypothetical protein